MSLIASQLALRVKIRSVASFRTLCAQNDVESDVESDGECPQRLFCCAAEESREPSTAAPSEAPSTPRSLSSEEEPRKLIWEKLLAEPDESLIGLEARAKPPRKFAAYEGVVTAIVNGSLKVRFNDKKVGEQLLPKGHAVELRREISSKEATVAADLEELRRSKREELLTKLRSIHAAGPHPLSEYLENQSLELRRELAMAENTGLCEQEAKLRAEQAEAEGLREFKASLPEALAFEEAAECWESSFAGISAGAFCSESVQPDFEAACREVESKGERRRRLRQADRAARCNRADDIFSDASFAGSMNLMQFVALMQSEAGKVPGPAC